MKDLVSKIHDYSLEEIMGDRFGKYAKTIIQDRAIPDVRDGLKPVQRRILYAMYKSGNTFDKPRRKAAKVVGDVMGSFHPHGDSSIYDALVRMSQWWKSNALYIDFKGNNGSIDGDSAAAYRYTEVRLAKVANELLKDINKNTIEWAPNFDDTTLEPTVLPTKFPVLLVNGATGISAGYATNIPPHNLGEVIDATVKRIDSPNCRLETIMEVMKGPDFPTGGIAEGLDGIIDAFKTGRGRVFVKSKYEIKKEKGKVQLVITEIPYDVNKSLLVKRIDEIRMDKKIDGILEVRDESDLQNPETIVVDIKKDANVDLIVNYLLKNTDMQISYNYNMVAIVDRRPMTIGVLEILDAYIKHQKDVITKRTEFDLATALKRMHIVEGLIKLIDILDEVIKTIRASKNKSDAIANLVSVHAFSEEQAKAIVEMQLYRLTNTDIEELENEFKNLKTIIATLESILKDENLLKNLMKDELRKIKKEYATPRKTAISEEVTEIKIDTTELIAKEDVIVVVSKDGYIKRVSNRSYNKDEITGLKELDYIIGLYEINTMDTVLLFTDLGNYLYLPVHEIPEGKWKELGKHVSNIIKLNPDENIIYSMPVYDFNHDQVVTLVTKNGMIKRSLLLDFKVSRYNKPMTAIKLKSDDKLVSVINTNEEYVVIATNNGYGLRYKIDEVPVTGVKTSGVKAISLKNDHVIGSVLVNDDDIISIITNKSTGKRLKVVDLEPISRARKGVQIVRDVKTNPYNLINIFKVDGRTILGLKTKEEIEEIKVTELPIADRYSTGTSISKQVLDGSFVLKTMETNKNESKEEIKEEEIVEEIEKIDLEFVDEKIMTIDDFLDDFEIEE